MDVLSGVHALSPRQSPVRGRRDPRDEPVSADPGPGPGLDPVNGRVHREDSMVKGLGGMGGGVRVLFVEFPEERRNDISVVTRPSTLF